MPAIQLALLRHQSAGLGEFFLQPDVFVRKLHDLLDFYADRTRRPGQIGYHPPRLPHYGVPAPVLAQVSADLIFRANEFGPYAALDLSDRLWQEGYYETRVIAVSILEIQAIPIEEIAARLKAWAVSEVDQPILSILLTNGKKALTREKPDPWMALVKEWLGANDIPIQAIGLRALKNTVEDPSFENLPAVYTLLGPIFQNAVPGIHADLAAVIEVAARRSPVEAMYFLRQTLSASSDPRIPRLVRRCIPFFDVENQEKLRGLLVAHSANH